MRQLFTMYSGTYLVEQGTTNNDNSLVFESNYHHRTSSNTDLFCDYVLVGRVIKGSENIA